MKVYNKLMFFLFGDRCIECGSKNIEKRGFEGHNERYACRNCGVVTWIE